MNQWPGVRLLVTEGWDEEGYHTPDSLHYEGRAVDITTSDRDRSKYGMLARLAVEAGFDWVYYESRAHIHCSVKSESSQAAKYGGCFSEENTVLTSLGVKRKLAELQIGEKILSHESTTQRLIFSEVILFLDYNPLERRRFLKIVLSSGRTITVTSNHLVFSGTLRKYRTVYAEMINIGDNLLVSGLNNTIVEDSVVQVKSIIKTGVFAPLTKVGTLVVNDVIASCYATVDSQPLAHWAFLPLRLVWNIKQGLFRVWTIINKPVISWSNAPTLVTNIRPSTGVHWYARMLYATAKYLLPSHLHQ